MSLDVYLDGEEFEVECVCSTCFHKHVRKDKETFYSDNITHNLNKMADVADIYMALWRPEEIGITKAHQLIPILIEGLAKLESDPAYFRQFDAPNGWGRYENFVPFVREYLAACKEYPEANVNVSR